VLFAEVAVAHSHHRQLADLQQTLQPCANPAQPRCAQMFLKCRHGSVQFQRLCLQDEKHSRARRAFRAPKIRLPEEV
jgi:predicted sulfurtransferase